MTTPFPTIQRLAVPGILAFGALLRTIQYAARGSMWLDELAIAINVSERGMWQLLFRPLELRQIAPPGFLFLEKLGTELLGAGEAGLRLFPWLASLASLFLFWRVAVRFASGPAVAAGLLAFAASPSLVWYAGTAKQYSGDVAVTLLLVLLAIRFEEERWSIGRAIPWGLAGGIAILASQPGVLVAAALGAVLLARRLRDRANVASLIALVAGWALGAAAVTAHSLRVVPPTVRSYMAGEWNQSFLPAPWDGPIQLLWIPNRLLLSFSHLLIRVLPKSIPEILFVAAFGGLAVAGAHRLVRLRRGAAVFPAVPPIVGFLAAGLRIMPLYNRLAMFFTPSLLLAAMMGADEVRERFHGRPRVVATALTLGPFALPALAVIALAPPPYRAEETRPVLEELRARLEPGDAIYVYYSAELAMRFYAPDLQIVSGGNHRADGRGYFREIDALRGRRRVWFFHTHGYPCEPEAIRSYLDAIGTELDRVEDPYGLRGQRETAAYLYDLSDPARLASAEAETHSYPVAHGAGWRRQGCGYNREPWELPS